MKVLPNITATIENGRLFFLIPIYDPGHCRIIGFGLFVDKFYESSLHDSPKIMSLQKLLDEAV